MTELASDYWHFYQREAVRFWQTLGPQEYATILIVVGAIGWLAMRSNLKR